MMLICLEILVVCYVVAAVSVLAAWVAAVVILLVQFAKAIPRVFPRKEKKLQKGVPHPHHPFCNYWVGPIGGPGCICFVTTKREKKMADQAEAELVEFRLQSSVRWMVEGADGLILKFHTLAKAVEALKATPTGLRPVKLIEVTTRERTMETLNVEEPVAKEG